MTAPAVGMAAGMESRPESHLGTSRKRVIERTTVMRDRRGVRWSPSPSYQDHDAGGEHWLELKSELGEQASFGDVCRAHGLVTDDGTLCLTVIRR